MPPGARAQGLVECESLRGAQREAGFARQLGEVVVLRRQVGFPGRVFGRAGANPALDPHAPSEITLEALPPPTADPRGGA